MAKRKNYPGTITKVGGSLRFRLYAGGKYHSYNFPGARKGDVIEFAREEYKRLKDQEDSGIFTEIVRFSELVARFERDHLPTLSVNSQISYPKSLRPLKAFFVDKLKDPKVTKLHSGHFESYLAWRRTHGPHGEEKPEPVSNRTLEKDRAIAHKMFSKAIKWRLVTSNPVSASDKPKPDTRDEIILTDEEYERLLAECSENAMLFLWCLVCGETGMRSRSEGLHLRWEDVDFADGFIHIDSTRHARRTKTGKGRWVPMTSRLHQAMQDHFAGFRFGAHLSSPSPWIFHHTTSRGGATPGNRVEEYRTPWLKAIERAELPDGFRMHDLRHRRITSWLAEGKPVTLVKEAVGHSALATTMHYTHLAKKHLRSLVDDPEDERKKLKELAR